jgi:hypothetical protein
LLSAVNNQQLCAYAVSVLNSWTQPQMFLTLHVLLRCRSPRHAAGRDSYLATLDFVDALCETSSSLTRFAPVRTATHHH